MSGGGRENDRGALVPITRNIRADQFDELERRVTDDADRDAVLQRVIDLGLARIREMEASEKNTKEPTSES